ncbi:MAG: hypothetical protein ACK4GK_07245 [Ferrovibrio sp.]
MSNSDPVELESGHAFRLRLMDDMYRKLRRELNRFGAAKSSRGDQIDAAINFAWTAWHMTDWFWEARKKHLKADLSLKSLQGFQDYVRMDSSALAVCDVIANAAKHGGVAKAYPNRPQVETILVAHPVDRTGSDVEMIAAMMDRKWSLKIRHGGKSEHAYVLFNRAYNRWHRFRTRYPPEDI